MLLVVRYKTTGRSNDDKYWLLLLYLNNKSCLYLRTELVSENDSVCVRARAFGYLYS